MKRLTSWPQVVLGLAFSWGALVGYAAVTGTLSWATIALYLGGVAWTMVYDTIYAMQDQRDDAVIGVRSTARRFAARAAALAHAVRRAGARGLGAGRPSRRASDRSTSPSWLAIALHFAWQIAFLRPHDQADCLSEVQGQCLARCAADRRPSSPAICTRHMPRLPADPEGFIRANTALEAPAMVPEFKLWLATEYVPIWQATEAWLEAHNVDPPYWAFCWPGGQAIAALSARQSGSGRAASA